jgi:hypothetical protein
MTTKKQNEWNACNAFIDILLSITGVKYTVDSSPDQVNRRTKDVDFILISNSDKNDKIAVEHTIVESYDGQLGYVSRSYDIVQSINDRCKEKISSGRYYFLAIPPVLVKSLTGDSREQFIERISSWVMKTGPNLLQVDTDAQTEFNGHEITLICRGDCPGINGNVLRISQAPENQKALSCKRLERAIQDKLPKLAKYKEQRFKTALLLEDVAGMLSDSVLKSYAPSLEKADYIVDFKSNENRMIVGDVIKEMSVWYSFVPYNRRFIIRKL